MQTTAYEWPMSDWISDVCSSDLHFINIPGDFILSHPKGGKPDAPLGNFICFTAGLACGTSHGKFAAGNSHHLKIYRRTGNLLNIISRLFLSCDNRNATQGNQKDR